MSDLLATLRELFAYLRDEGKWWLVPAILAIVLLWAFLTTAGTSAVPVFIYPVA